MLKDADDALHEAESTLRWIGDVTAITYKTVDNGDLKSLQLQKRMDKVIATLNSSKERPPGNIIMIDMVHIVKDHICQRGRVHRTQSNYTRYFRDTKSQTSVAYCTQSKAYEVLTTPEVIALALRRSEG